MKKAYPKYRELPFPWPNRIPAGWELAKVSSAFTERKETVSDKDYEPLSVTKEGIVPQLETAAKTDNGDNRKKVLAGDFVINSRSDRKGSSGLSKYDGSVSVINTVLKPLQDKAEGKYIEYLLKNYFFQEEFYRYGKGIVDDLWSTKYSNMKGMPIPLPSLPEQRQIAAFLDHKCTLIDTFIQKKTRLIELLKEQKQAIINKAVTKGLPAEARAKAGIDPNVRLKPSGIDWLGDIPEHWEVTKIKMYCEVKDGTHDTPSYVEKSEEAFPLVTSKDFINGEIDFSEVKYISKEDHREIVKRSNTENGDIIMSMIGGNIGSLVVVNTDSEISIKNVALFKTSHDPILTSYLRYILLSNLLKIQIGLKSRGGGQPFLSLSDLRNLLFIKIPREEMKDICFFLNKELEQIDWTITRINQEIKFVKEYKTTLIAEAVTGKIDVRGWKAKSA